MFPLSYHDLLEKVANIDPVVYAETHNFTDGAVTRLSPYITRGVISLPFIRDKVLEKYSREQSFKFIQELAWREYFQRVWEVRGDDIFTDIRFAQSEVEHYGMPLVIADAASGISAVDAAVKELCEVGYMHNHARMTLASIICNLGHYGWWQPSQWMYYHLLDGDLASNSLSWQWVAGTSISKKYTTSQSLVNYWAHTNDCGTFIDFERDDFLDKPTPKRLEVTHDMTLETVLPDSDALPENMDRVLLYHLWHLDPQWRRDEEGVRILLLEPAHFEKHPVSEKVINFIIELARTNIPDIRVYVGNPADLGPKERVFTRAYPAIAHWDVVTDQREYLFPEVSGYHKSFFAYWKQCEKLLKNQYG